MRFPQAMAIEDQDFATVAARAHVTDSNFLIAP
jgi:hypothetical protein